MNPDKITQASSRTILFITGAFIHHGCWDEWLEYFRQQGYTVHAPAWLHKDSPPEILRGRHPDPEVASIRLRDLTGHYQAYSEALAEKPIIIGHSIGGLVAQLLVQKGLAVAAVMIHSVPPRGVFTLRLSFLRAGWGPLGYFTNRKKTFMMSFSQWQYAFSNGMPAEWQEKAYQLAIPESKLVVRDTITSMAGVDFDRPHVPLLFIAGSSDHSIPASLNLSNFRKYRDPDSTREYKVFRDRNHSILLQPGWQEVAQYIHSFIIQNNIS